MSKKVCIIVLSLGIALCIAVFAYISFRHGLDPILAATSPKNADKILSIWTICLFAAFCVILGSMGSVVAILCWRLFRDTLVQKLDLNDQTVATEVLNLKFHIGLIYSIVPIVFLFLSLLGIQGYNELTNLSGVAEVREAKKEWPKIKNGWSKIDTKVSAKADSVYVDATFLKMVALEDSIRRSKIVSAKADSVYVDATFLKMVALEDSIRRSKIVSAKADSVYVDATFLKMVALEDSIRRSKIVSAKADSVYVDATFLKMVALEDSIRRSKIVSAKADSVYVDATFLKMVALEDSIRRSKIVSAKADSVYVDATFLKMVALEDSIMNSTNLKTWIRNLINQPNTGTGQ